MLLNNKPLPVHVSEVRSYLNCPRQLYYMSSALENRYNFFSSRFSDSELCEMIIKKEVLYRLPSVLLETESSFSRENKNSVPFKELKNSLISNVNDTIDTIGHYVAVSESLNGTKKDTDYISSFIEKTDVSDSCVLQACVSVKKNIETLCKNAYETRLFFGQNIYRSIAYPWRSEYYVYSDLMSFGGILSKVVLIPHNSINRFRHSSNIEISNSLYSENLFSGDALYIPYITRFSKSPHTGVWRDDRLIAAGCSLLMRERKPFNSEKISFFPVFIDYMGSSRIVFLNRSDEIRFFRALEEARSVLSGHLPSRVKTPFCGKCFFYGKCHPKPKSFF